MPRNNSGLIFGVLLVEGRQAVSLGRRSQLSLPVCFCLIFDSFCLLSGAPIVSYSGTKTSEQMY